MTDGWVGGDAAEEANDFFASAYDDFNYRYQNTRWTGRLLQRAEVAGLKGDRLLDVACGTGLSFIPMLRRGWKVTACDISGQMVEIARSKVGDQVNLAKADMRELPVFGAFDLVWALNDAMNYLLSKEELVAALVGMRKNLAPGGVLLFDVNTLATYRSFFASEIEVRVKNRHLLWSGRTRPDEVEPGLIAEARFEAVGELGSVHVHRQRHFSEQDVREALSSAHLEAVEILGVSEPEGDLQTPLDEGMHTKAVYVCIADDQSSPA